MTRPYKNQQKKKRTQKIVDFAVPADNWVKLKGSEKKNEYLDLTTELKKLWNMKMTFIPIVIGALGTVTEGLLKVLVDLEIKGRVETIQILHNWDQQEYRKESWRLEETSCHSSSSEKLSRNKDNNNNNPSQNTKPSNS